MVVIKDIQIPAEKVTFWWELNYIDYEKLKFSPFGSASIAIPDFYRDRIQAEIANMSIKDFQFTDQLGSVETWNAITKHFSKIAHLENIDPKKNIAVSLGATWMIYLLVNHIIKNEYDEAIVFEPYYPHHLSGFKNKGIIKSCRMIFDFEEKVWKFNFKDFEKLLSKNTKLVIFCNPNNPTCHMIKKQEFEEFTRILNKFPEVKVIEDSAYATYINSENKISYFHEFDQNFTKSFTIFSAGKIFNTTGNRFGFFFADEKNTNEFKFMMNDNNGVGTLDQKFYSFALESALKPYSNNPDFWTYQRKDILHRIEYVIESLKQFGVKCYPSEGTYYMNIDSTYLSTFVDKSYFYTLGPKPVYDKSRDKAVCRVLVLKYLVGVLPLSALTFYEEALYDDFIRVACNRSYDELDIFISAIKSLVTGSSDSLESSDGEC